MYIVNRLGGRNFSGRKVIPAEAVCSFVQKTREALQKCEDFFRDISLYFGVRQIEN